MNTVDRYPGIKRAALEIALDNGGINRGRAVEDQTEELNDWLDDRPEENLSEIDAWLAGLSDEDLSAVCAGEHTEMMVVLQGAPAGTDDLLNAYFEEVC